MLASDADSCGVCSSITKKPGWTVWKECFMMRLGIFILQINVRNALYMVHQLYIMYGLCIHVIYTGQLKTYKYKLLLLNLTFFLSVLLFCEFIFIKYSINSVFILLIVLSTSHCKWEHALNDSSIYSITKGWFEFMYSGACITASQSYGYRLVSRTTQTNLKHESF